MKLFARYNRINIFSMVCIFLFSALAYYFVLRYVLIHVVDENLLVEEAEIKTFAAQHDRLPDMMTVQDQIIEFYPRSGKNAVRQFSSVLFKEPQDKEAEMFRQLSFPLRINGQEYTVVVKRSLEGTDALIKVIALITLLTLLLILVVGYFVNRNVLRKLWRPFYTTVNQLQEFRIGQRQPVFDRSNIEEFDLLNERLSTALQKAEKDYLALKEFTENASHELQTPVAIIRSKLDLLIQDKDLSEAQSRSVHAAYSSLQKLSHLNSSLLLLTKIENKQFSQIRSVDMQQLLNDKIRDLDELFETKQLTIQTVLQPATIKINEVLAEQLLNNLLSNAITHSNQQSVINIHLTKDQLSVSNTGRNQALAEEKIFNRFYKSETDNEGTGLGLSIIRQICDQSNLQCSYSFQNGIHAFTITW